MTNYTTEKRKAKVGERILITNSISTAGKYKDGDVMTVSEDRIRFLGVRTEELSTVGGPFIAHGEYEVITDQPDHKSQATAAVELLIAQAYAKGYVEGMKDTRKDVARKATEDALREAAEKITEKARQMKPIIPAETPQQARDRIVEQAKADIEALTIDWYGQRMYKPAEGKYSNYICSAKFYVNKDKRVVVAVLLHKFEGTIAKGIAKCDPSDCFNEHIGRAISIRRALGLEVPVEYLEVPQPTEVRVGDVVYSNRTDDKYVVSDGFDVDDGKLSIEYVKALRVVGELQAIDDSRTEASE